MPYTQEPDFDIENYVAELKKLHRKLCDEQRTDAAKVNRTLQIALTIAIREVAAEIEGWHRQALNAILHIQAPMLNEHEIRMEEL